MVSALPSFLDTEISKFTPRGSEDIPPEREETLEEDDEPAPVDGSGDESDFQSEPSESESESDSGEEYDEE